MRLAAYGWVDAASGSVASAGDLILRALVDLGVEVDFLANRHHVATPEGLPSPAFRYVGVEPPAGYQRLPERLQGLLNRVFGPLTKGAWRRQYDRAREKEGRGHYDALLSLGTLPPFRVPQCPTVAWLQGPPQTELEAIRELRPQIVATSGTRFWLTLAAYYRYKQMVTRNDFTGIDVGIVGSTWSVKAFDRWPHPSPRRVTALPYPIDLTRFGPSEHLPDVDRPTILHIGRLDPRKRLDLLLDAFRQIHTSEPAAQLLIVGSAGYAPNQLSLLDAVRDLPGVTYRPSIARSEVIPLIQTASMVIQTSMNENFGSAVAEAMACGTPVVVGPTNGTADYICRSSAVFTTYTPASVAEAVLEVLRRQRADPLGVRTETRATAEEHFDAHRLAQRVVDLVGERTDP